MELKQKLLQAGFTELLGKGSNTNWVHPLYPGKLTVSGKNSSDAKPYQEKDVQQAIREVEERQQQEKQGNE